MQAGFIEGVGGFCFVSYWHGRCILLYLRLATHDSFTSMYTMVAYGTRIDDYSMAIGR
jgi:hypothetical protein